ncbi:hypothetical protein [Shewanella maritima]|uniref:hypothetical protein n=1 Tax=Shewanella maritima TaxID=2520507 RepID=UPI001F5E74D7|nr:hypothetical protein [Shewanella maritima]
MARTLFNGDASSVNPFLSTNISVTERFAALVCYQRRYSQHENYVDSGSIEYFDDWPANFYQELDDVTAGAESRLIDLFNRTSFSSIFGNLILDSQCLLPEGRRPHFIYLTMMDYLHELVSANPKSKKPNVADMLVSVAETSVILSATHEQVYRLYQEGILTSGFRQKLRSRIEPHIGVFYLRQVIEFKASFGGNPHGVYLSAW